MWMYKYPRNTQGDFFSRPLKWWGSGVHKSEERIILNHKSTSTYKNITLQTIYWLFVFNNTSPQKETMNMCGGRFTIVGSKGAYLYKETEVLFNEKRA